MFIRGPWRAWAILVLILAVQVAQHRSTFAQSPGTPAPSTPTPTPTPAAPEAATPALELKGILDITILDKGYGVNGAQGKAIHVVATADIPTLGVFGLGVARNGNGTTGEAQIMFSAADSALAGDNILLVRSIKAMNEYMDAETIFDKVTSVEKALEAERSQANDYKSRYNRQREWRGFCLCSANMFVNGDAFTEMCFEDLRSACFSEGNDADYFGNGLCELLSDVDEGSVSNTFMNTMDYEVKKKCKHPYRSEGPEFLLFFKDTIKVENEVLQVMGSAKFDGNMFSELTEEQAQYIRLPLQFYRNLLDVKKYMIMNGKTVPYSVGREAVNQVSTVEASMQVNDVFDINEREFTFQAAFTLSFAWTDENMWADCMGTDDEVDEGVCQWVWRPNPRWKNARELIVMKKSLNFMPAYKSAFYILECRGTFSTPMSFKKFPRDKQSLLIEFSLEPSEGGTSDSLYENFRFSPVTAFSNSNTEGDTISGWFLQDVNAREEKKMRTQEPAFLFNKSNSTVWSAMEDEIERLYEDYLLPVEYESSVIVSIEVERVTSYYMLNYVLVAAMLASMSMVCCLLSPEDLNDRATLSLTIILALNVFQLVMNSSMPETGYLTSLTAFIIASTLFVAFVTIESVVVFILHRRTVMREEVVRKLGGLSLEPNSVVPVTDVEEAKEGEVAEGKGLRRRGSLDHIMESLAGKNVEKLLAYNLDKMCMVGLPVAYTLMTVMVFDIVKF